MGLGLLPAHFQLFNIPTFVSGRGEGQGHWRFLFFLPFGIFSPSLVRRTSALGICTHLWTTLSNILGPRKSAGPGPAGKHLSFLGQRGILRRVYQEATAGRFQGERG